MGGSRVNFSWTLIVWPYRCNKMNSYYTFFCHINLNFAQSCMSIRWITLNIWKTGGWYIVNVTVRRGFQSPFLVAREFSMIKAATQFASPTWMNSRSKVCCQNQAFLQGQWSRRLNITYFIYYWKWKLG